MSQRQSGARKCQEKENEDEKPRAGGNIPYFCNKLNGRIHFSMQIFSASYQTEKNTDKQERSKNAKEKMIK